MILKYNLEKLSKVISDFQKLTGISIAIRDTDFRSLIICRSEEQSSFCSLIQQNPEGLARCDSADKALLSHCKCTKSSQTHVCHAGLSDTGVPIIENGVILGYIIFGQVCDSPHSVAEFSKIYPRIMDLGLDPAALQAAYERIPFVESSSIESASELVKILTKYIWLEHMIHHDDTANEIVTYIDQHLGEPLEVSDICERFHLSKNALYKLFHEHFQSTVNDYVTARRIDEAERLLTQTTLAVYQVGEAVGIHNDQYFCRLFKRIKGLPPLQYRRRHTEKEEQHHPSL